MPYSSRIPQVIAEITAGIEQVVDRTGLRIETGAKQRARYKFGYMRGQIRWYKGQQATGFTGDKENPVSLEPSGPFSGQVVGGADYTIYNEFGTIHMSAQPMFGPATEEARPYFDAEINLVIKKALGG